MRRRLSRMDSPVCWLKPDPAESGPFLVLPRALGLAVRLAPKKSTLGETSKVSWFVWAPPSPSSPCAIPRAMCEVCPQLGLFLQAMLFTVLRIRECYPKAIFARSRRVFRQLCWWTDHPLVGKYVEDLCQDLQEAICKKELRRVVVPIFEPNSETWKERFVVEFPTDAASICLRLNDLPSPRRRAVSAGAGTPRTWQEAQPGAWQSSLGEALAAVLTRLEMSTAKLEASSENHEEEIAAGGRSWACWVESKKPQARDDPTQAGATWMGGEVEGVDGGETGNIVVHPLKSVRIPASWCGGSSSFSSSEAKQEGGDLEAHGSVPDDQQCFVVLSAYVEERVSSRPSDPGAAESAKRLALPWLTPREVATPLSTSNPGPIRTKSERSEGGPGLRGADGYSLLRDASGFPEQRPHDQERQSEVGSRGHFGPRGPIRTKSERSEGGPGLRGADDYSLLRDAPGFPGQRPHDHERQSEVGSRGHFGPRGPIRTKSERSEGGRGLIGDDDYSLLRDASGFPEQRPHDQERQSEAGSRGHFDPRGPKRRREDETEDTSQFGLNQMRPEDEDRTPLTKKAVREVKEVKEEKKEESVVDVAPADVEEDLEEEEDWWGD